MTRLLWLTMICALIGIWEPADARVYKWVDKDGNVHYTATPPPDDAAQSEVVDTSSSRLRESQRRQAEQMRQSRQQQSEPPPRDPVAEGEAAEQARADQQSEADAEYEAQIQAACRTARANLSVMESGRRVFEKDANGEDRYLNEEEYEQRKRQYEDQVNEYCN